MKKKTLFIITDHYTYKKILNFLNNSSFRSSENFILSFNRILLEKIKRKKIFESQNIFDGNEIIEDRIDLNGKKISLILKKLLFLNSDFYLSKFSELNNADNFYTEFLINDVILSTIKKKKITNIFSDITLQNISNKINVNYFKSENKNFINIFFIKYFLISLRNLLNEICASFFLKKKLTKINKLIVTNLKDNWIIKNNKCEYIYLKNYNNKSNYSYLVSCLRNNTNVHNNFLKYINNINLIKKKNNIFILEAWIDFFSILKNYFFGYLFFIKNYMKFKKFFIKNNILSYHNIICSFYLIDYPKNKNLEDAMKNFFSYQKNIKKLCIPVFELNDGKIACKIGNDFNINTFGIQHGYFNIWHKWRFFYNLKACSTNNKNFFPRNIFFFGSNTYNWYKNEKNIDKRIIGNQRTIKLPKKYNFNKVNKNNILILLDLRDWYEKVLELNNVFKKTKYNLFIKAHPFTITKVKKLIKKKGLIKNFQFIHDLNYFKNKYPKFVLSSDTGAIIEFTEAGWPCFLLNNTTKPNISPLLNLNKNLLRLNLTNKLILDIEKLQSIELKRYVKKQQFFSNSHIHKIGKDAAKNFKKFF